MTLRQKQRLFLVLYMIGLAILLMDTGIGAIGLAVLGVVVLVAALILNLMWLRCPECGKWLGRDPGTFCKSCGTQILWDEKTKRNL